MKKILIAALMLLGLAYYSNAQFLRFGIKGGISSSTVKVNDVVKLTDGSAEYKLKTYNPSVGFQFGVFARIKVFNLFLQPEVLFANSGGEVKIREVNADSSFIRSQHFNRISIPVMVGTKVGPIRLEAGPAFSFTLSQKNDLFDMQGYKEDFKKATIGYQAGLGFDLFKKVTFDLKYEGSLSKLGSGVTIGGTTYPYDTRTSQWIASIGIFL